MSKNKKLLEKVKNNPSNITIEELLTLMDHYGFTKRPTGHGYFFKNEQLTNVILPHVAKPHGRENKVKKKYVDDCLEVIELIESLEGGLNDE